MPKKLLSLSAVGRDRTGIVSSISKVLFDLGCNIEDSTMTLLSGQFAMILLIACHENADLVKIKTKLKTVLKQIGLSCSVNEIVAGGKKIKTFGNYVVSVYGADKPGIVYSISKYLSDNGINITDVQTSVAGARDKVYIMLLEVQIPKKMNVENIKSRMLLLSKELNVDVSFNQADSQEI